MSGIPNFPERRVTPVSGQRIYSTAPVVPFTKEEIEGSILDRFERIVGRFSDRLAIKVGSQTLTYAELNKESNRVAQTILAQRGDSAEPVALLLDHDIVSISGLLGVLKAGKGYVSLDPSFPRSRLIDILKDVQPALIVTNEKNLSFAHELAQNGCQLLDIDELETRFSDEKVNISLAPDSLAAIFYTSGSTGQPKGIVWNHRNTLYFAWHNTNTYHLCPDDRHSLLFSCSFGVSVTNIFCTLLNGATLYPYYTRRGGLEHLIKWLMQEGITLFHPPVTLFRQLLGTLTGIENFPQLRLVILGGQPVYKHDVECFRKYFSENCLLLHRLAATEVGEIAQFFIDQRTEISENIVPAGYPIDGKELVLLDETGQKVSVNQIGEIAVRSRYLSPGYWGKPELTRQKFLPDPEGGDKRIYLTGDLGRMHPDGCLEHLGRKDFQVKIRGYRVELAEVEAALYQLDAVKEAVVVAKKQPSGDTFLVAYLVAASQPAPTVSELRRSLAEQLPDYMIPLRFVLLETLPLTPTGKVNREALPSPDGSRPDVGTPFVAPRTELERQLALICEELLGVQPIGVKDNFFDLGGNSLSFVRLLTEIEQLIGKALPVNDVLATPSIEKISKMLRLLEQTSSPSDQGDYSKVSEGYNPLRVLLRLFRLPHLSWAKKRSRARVILQEVLAKHGPTCGRVVLPYPLGTRFLAWFCGNRLIQACLLRKRVRSFQAFLPTVSRSPEDAELIRQHLAANVWKHWRVHALARCPPPQFARWVSVSGQAILQQAYEQQKGVIVVNSHFVVSQVAKLVLRSLGCTDYQAVGVRSVLQAETFQLRYMRHASGSKAVRRSFLQLLSQFHAGQKRLQAGGIMIIGGDGGSGLRGVWLPFHGRRMEFKTGFAEAAVNTGAAVIPVCVSLKPATGHLHVEYLDPLDSGTPEMSHEQRVAWLMQQYVTLLEQRWLQDPANLEWGMIQRFLASAPLDA